MDYRASRKRQFLLGSLVEDRIACDGSESKKVVVSQWRRPTEGDRGTSRGDGLSLPGDGKPEHNRPPAPLGSIMHAKLDTLSVRSDGLLAESHNRRTRHTQRVERIPPKRLQAFTCIGLYLASYATTPTKVPYVIVKG